MFDFLYIAKISVNVLKKIKMTLLTMLSVYIYKNITLIACESTFIYLKNLFLTLLSKIDHSPIYLINKTIPTTKYQFEIVISVQLWIERHTVRLKKWVLKTNPISFAVLCISCVNYPNK